MKSPQFPEFVYQQPVVRNINTAFEEQAGIGQKGADWVVRMVGSWRFIIAQSILLLIWIVLNITGWVFQWDPYPFILMNLVLSTQAAFAAPIIMMSQNRQAAKDRLESHHDYEVDLKAEAEIRLILEQLEAQNRALTQLYEMLAALKADPS
jgi:uncharacterized membrane protein